MKWCTWNSISWSSRGFTLFISSKYYFLEQISILSDWKYVQKGSKCHLWWIAMTNSNHQIDEISGQIWNSPKNLKRKIEKNESFEIHPNAEPRGVLYVGGFALWMDNAHASAKKDFPFGGYSSPSARSKPKPPPKFCNPSKFTQPLGPNWPKPNFSYPRNLGNPWETSETPNWSDPWTWGKKKGNAGKYEIEASLSEQQ